MNDHNDRRSQVPYYLAIGEEPHSLASFAGGECTIILLEAHSFCVWLIHRQSSELHLSSLGEEKIKGKGQKWG